MKNFQHKALPSDLKDVDRLVCLTRRIPSAFALVMWRCWSNAVSLVGARQSTGAGRQMAESMAAGLVVRGCTVVSGLAVGIDAAAHQGATESGGITALFSVQVLRICIQNRIEGWRKPLSVQAGCWCLNIPQTQLLGPISFPSEIDSSAVCQK